MLLPQHHLLIPSLTRKAGRWCPETKPRLWVPGAPQRPCVAARAVAGGRARGGEGGNGRSAAPAPALLSYCATASAPRPGSTLQLALRTCPSPKGQSCTRVSAPPNPPRSLHGQWSPSTQWPHGLREHLTPRGSNGRTWLSYLEHPCLAPLRPPCPGSTLPSRSPLPPSAPKSQPSSFPTRSISVPHPPPAPNYRHSSEGKGPDVRPVAKGKRG